VWQGGDWKTVRAPQPRVVLAVLLTEAGSTVSVDRLVDEIWGDHPPQAAVNTVQSYVVRLRRLLGDSPSRLITAGRGYQLLVADDELDSRAFETLVESGQRHLQGGRPADAVDQLATALALWRGPAMNDVPASPAVTAEAIRLEQRRLTALECRLGAELVLGRHAETVDELERLVAEYPLREGLRRHLMLALYRCGRRAEALDRYREGRAVLVTEFGMEPGPGLRDLERAILADDERLVLASGPAVTSVAELVSIPAQLPADVGGFIGREHALRVLDGIPDATVIRTITGMAGVGKTALAVHWAHRVRDRFADGQLYVNLRGYASGRPLRPIEALARFLHALGVPAGQVPTDDDEAAALYRTRLAGRRMLILLDNAGSPDQVRPLLPGVPGCVVLVTSRDNLAGLLVREGAYNIRLDVLTDAEARLLLTNLLGADRLGAESDTAAELAALCARLPLALRLAAAQPRHSATACRCGLHRAVARR
jgi:DNA-binding SARP family transcriptional activator